ncbi:transposase family protein [Niveispirillum irakense]|uniref:transposase family protein n=1 Tax=Niveispirillum irakense TaxID=34011 RepID=UPI001AEBE364
MKVAGDRVQVWLRSRYPSATCPGCGRPSRRVQSRYMRRPADLPLGGRQVELTIVARRFRCDAVLCGRRIFCEQFDDSVLARYGDLHDRSSRAHVVQQPGEQVPGEPFELSLFQGSFNRPPRLSSSLAVSASAVTFPPRSP